MHPRCNPPAAVIPHKDSTLEPQTCRSQGLVFNAMDGAKKLGISPDVARQPCEFPPVVIARDIDDGGGGDGHMGIAITRT